MGLRYGPVECANCGFLSLKSRRYCVPNPDAARLSKVLKAVGFYALEPKAILGAWLLLLNYGSIVGPTVLGLMITLLL